MPIAVTRRVLKLSRLGEFFVRKLLVNFVLTWTTLFSSIFAWLETYKTRKCENAMRKWLASRINDIMIGRIRGNCERTTYKLTRFIVWHLLEIIYLIDRNRFRANAATDSVFFPRPFRFGDRLFDIFRAWR